MVEWNNHGGRDLETRSSVLLDWVVKKWPGKHPGTTVPRPYERSDVVVLWTGIFREDQKPNLFRIQSYRILVGVSKLGMIHWLVTNLTDHRLQVNKGTRTHSVKSVKTKYGSRWSSLIWLIDISGSLRRITRIIIRGGRGQESKEIGSSSVQEPHYPDFLKVSRSRNRRDFDWNRRFTART